MDGKFDGDYARDAEIFTFTIMKLIASKLVDKPNASTSSDFKSQMHLLVQS